MRARVGFQRGGERVAVRPHRHAPRWRSHALPARVAPMLAAIPSHAFTSWRFRVIGTGPAVGAAPPRTVSAVCRRPLRFVSTRRRGVHAALLFVPHRDPLRLLPPRAAPDAVAALSAGGGCVCRAGLRPYGTRWRTHARGFPARSRPPDGHRHPKPFAAPPCSSLRSCGAASRRTAQGRALGRASPRVCGRRQWVGGAIARAASDRPTARHAGGSRGERQPEIEADSPRSDARYERAPSAATLSQIPRVCPVLLSLLAAGTGQRRKISYEGPHGSG